MDKDPISLCYSMSSLMIWELGNLSLSALRLCYTWHKSVTERWLSVEYLAIVLVLCFPLV